MRASVSPGVVILAAGASSRMGKPKLLLPWGSTSILGHLIQQWQTVGVKQIGVVLAPPDNPAVAAELDRLGFSTANRILNPAPERGMFSSIQCAANWPGWDSRLTHWAIVLGDQPHLQPETLRALLDFSAAHPESVCQPGRGGRQRHPVLLPRGVFERLKNSDAETLKQFLQSAGSERVLCELEDPGLDFDIDQPADYERAIQLCFKSTPPPLRATG
jgi:molybdenum cofactor cytidylyltransferase